MLRTILPSYIRPVGEPVSLKQSSAPVSYQGFSERYLGSGTMALQYALQQVQSAQNQQTSASNQAARCEILLPAYACPDLVSACIGAGVIPVLVDLAPDSAFPSLASIKEKLTAQTTGVILINFHGISPPKDLFDDIKALGLASIEDRAQSFICPSEASQLLGDYVIFSYGKGKPVSLLGGGLVLSRSTSATKDATGNKISTNNKNDSPPAPPPWTFRLKVALYNTRHSALLLLLGC